MKKSVKIGLIVFFSLLILASIWLTFFYYHKCENQTCFNDYLQDCRKATFISNNNMVFEYTIQKQTKFNCIVEVKLLQGDLSNQDSLKLEKKQMQCYLPLNTVVVPEADISLCKGELREGLQELIIQKLHAYIVQNLGKINADLLKIR